MSRPDPGRRDRPTSAITGCSRGPSRAAAPGPHRDDVPCRPRGSLEPGRDPRRARAGGPRPARLAVRRAQGPVGGVPRPPGRGPCRRPRGRGRAAIATVDRELPAHDLAHYRGRLVVDLRPRTAGGKREAFEELLADLRPATVVAFGDDVSDADGFAVLRAARRRRGRRRPRGRRRRAARDARRGPRRGGRRARHALRGGPGAGRDRERRSSG